MTHRLPSLFLPKRRTSVIVIPHVNTSPSGGATLYAGLFGNRSQLPGFSRCFPAPHLSPLPLSKKSPLLLSLRLLTQLQQVLLSIYYPCQRQREAHAYRKIPPLLVDTGDRKGAALKGLRGKREKGFGFCFSILAF